MKHIRLVATISILLGLLLIYIAGIGVRGRYGIKVVVRNSTQQALRDVQIKVQSRGGTSRIPDIPPGTVRTAYVQPITESHIDLLFLDGHVAPRSTTVVGYAEQGYCGKVTIDVREDGDVHTRDGTHIDCFGGWFDFL